MEQPNTNKQNKSKTIVVIGAGASGLVAAKEFIKYNNHKVIIIESADNVGGLWYANNKRSVVYDQLRVNLPREIMAYRTQSFRKKWVDGRQFPLHTEIHEYLKEYAKEIRNHISFNEEVLDVKHVGVGQWLLSTSKRSL